MTADLTEEGLVAAFDRADADADGKLDLVGFTVVLDGLGLSWSRRETQERFERTDTNRDGLISLAELRALLRTYGWTA